MIVVAPAWSAEPIDELVFELARTYQLLSSPTSDKPAKTKQIDELMTRIETLIVANADGVQSLQTRLGAWNQQLQAQLAGGRVPKLHGDLENMLRRAGITSNGRLPDPATIKSMVDSFQVFLAPLSQPDAPEKYKYRAKMGVEWLRHLARMEEDNLFGLASQEPPVRMSAAKKLAADMQNITRRSRALMRLTQIFGAAIDVQRVPDPLDPSRTTMQIKVKEIDLTPQMGEIFEHLDTLGTFYGKMGQTFSNMDMFFGPDITKWFSALQSQYKGAMPFEQVRQMFREDFGRDIEELYHQFDELPFARGTMAQAHFATRKNPKKEVVVKVQRPGLLEELRWNSGINTAMIKFMKVIAADPGSTEVLDMVNDQLDGMVSSFAGETFFHIEAEMMEAFRPRLGFLDGAGVPRAHLDLVSPRIITMDKVKGRSIDAFLSDPSTTRRAAEKAFRQLLDTLTDFALVGHGHIDLQPGNLLVTDEGRLILLDWGNTAHLRGLISKPISLMLAMRSRDPKRIADALAHMQKEGGTVTGEQLLPYIEGHLGMMGNIKHGPWQGLLGPNRRKPGERGQFPVRLDPIDQAKTHDIPPFLKVVLDSSMKLGYRLDPEYARILRGAIPLLGTLDRFETRLGTDMMRNLMIRHPISLAFKGPFKLANFVLRHFTHPIPAFPSVPCKYGLLDTEAAAAKLREYKPNTVAGAQ